LWLFLRPTEAKIIARADTLVQQGNPDEGLALLQDYLRDHPESAGAKKRAAEIQEQLNQMEKQRKADAIVLEARTLRDARKWDEAILKYQQALELHPAHDRAKKELMDVKAQRDASAETARNQHVQELIADARQLSNQKKYDAAENKIREALAVDPENANAKTIQAEIAKALQTSGHGTISIQCEPFCRVFIDGKDLGDSPYARKQISSGPHTIRVAKTGFKEISEKIVIKNGDVVDKYYTLEKQ
jgi:tetratricopeptide (TPR) repeat protein